VQKIWFVYSNGIVNGPFDTQKVREGLTQGNWTSSAFVWWKGQREWMPIRIWENQLEKILKAETEKIQSPVWYVDVSGSPVGPLTQKEMLDHLQGISDLNRVRLWTVGMNKWTNLFDLHNIMDQLGLSRREHERAPLLGTVVVTQNSENAPPIHTRAASISGGGIGLNGAQGLTRGDEVQLLVKSNEFPNPIRVKAVVAYVTSQGYAGLRFLNIHQETSALIFDYVRKFNRESGGQQDAA
jgi:hypothetical protein